MMLAMVSERLKGDPQWTYSSVIADLVGGTPLPREDSLVQERQGEIEVQTLEELFHDWQARAIASARQDIAFYLHDASDTAAQAIIDQRVSTAGVAFCVIGLLTHESLGRVTARYDRQAVQEALALYTVTPAALVTVDRWHMVLPTLPHSERAASLLQAIDDLTPLLGGV